MCRALGGLLSTLALKMDEIEHDLVREQLIYSLFIFIFCVILFWQCYLLFFLRFFFSVEWSLFLFLFLFFLDSDV